MRGSDVAPFLRGGTRAEGGIASCPPPLRGFREGKRGGKAEKPLLAPQGRQCQSCLCCWPGDRPRTHRASAAMGNTTAGAVGSLPNCVRRRMVECTLERPECQLFEARCPVGLCPLSWVATPRSLTYHEVTRGPRAQQGQNNQAAVSGPHVVWTSFGHSKAVQEGSTVCLDYSWARCLRELRTHGPLARLAQPLAGGKHLLDGAGGRFGYPPGVNALSLTANPPGGVREHHEPTHGKHHAVR